MLTLTLPYPPSVNHYWRTVSRNGRPRVLMTAAGLAYRTRVATEVAHLGLARPLSGRLSVQVRLHAPDRRQRDLDNCMKALLDALTHAGAWKDDDQVDRLVIERGEVLAPRGACSVLVEERA